MRDFTLPWALLFMPSMQTKIKMPMNAS
uniref:Uncharacterized protein n=1 Tax=Anguilla anguilla TaxID=7936 RepID=A0A0E9RJX1_ANGAN